MNKFWNFTTGADGRRTLRIEGYIIDADPWFLEDEEEGNFTVAKEFKKELGQGESDIDLWINSGGGDVFAANEIYNALREYPGKVTVKIDTLAASAASVVAMAGDTIEISRVGLIMIHDPMTLVIGNARELENAATRLVAIKNSLINAYEAKTGLDREVIGEYMSRETVFDANEAVRVGFADRIIGEEVDPAPAVNAAMFSRKNVYKALMAGFGENKLPPAKRVKAAGLYKKLDNLK